MALINSHKVYIENNTKTKFVDVIDLNELNYPILSEIRLINLFMDLESKLYFQKKLDCNFVYFIEIIYNFIHFN